MIDSNAFSIMILLLTSVKNFRISSVLIGEQFNLFRE